MKILVFVILLLINNSALASWQETDASTACDITNDAFEYFKDHQYHPWVLSTVIDTTNISVLTIIWRNDDTSAIAVTTTQIGSTITCVVALGNSNTTIVDSTNDVSN